MLEGGDSHGAPFQQVSGFMIVTLAESCTPHSGASTCAWVLVHHGSLGIPPAVNVLIADRSNI